MGRWSKGLLFVIVLLLAGVAVVQTGVWVQAISTDEYDRTNVTAIDASGTELATVDARVADTAPKQAVGLSETDELGPDEGMVFVFDEPAERSFVMRGMDFPIDIIFADENGTVTTIHHASAPDGPRLAAQLEQYTGEGKYVLETNRGWANRTGLSVGDRLAIPGETPTPEGPTVTTVDTNGTTLATVRVTLATDDTERYTGLSDTESLDANEGMLFVYSDEDDRAFVMRDMDFPIDIVFVAANGTVTEIHHAPLPPEGASGSDLERYRGYGQYVLEVNRGWTNETGLDVGDEVRVPANVTVSS